MGLKWKTLTAKDLATAFMGASDAGKAAAYATLEKETNTIKDISVLMAPVDTGELEAGHKVTKRSNGSNKITFDVTVGGIINGVNVDAYAMKLHEGSYNLGKKSEAKQGTSQYTVGNKFLQRAYDQRIEITIKKIYDAVTEKVGTYVG